MNNAEQFDVIRRSIDRARAYAHKTNNSILIDHLQHIENEIALLNNPDDLLRNIANIKSISSLDIAEVSDMIPDVRWVLENAVMDVVRRHG